jgi:hypothetical protein
MKATRFSMTLYISLPVLASACSVVMIAHFVLLAEGRISPDGRYGDMYAYIALAESFGFFGPEIISFRVLAPLISGGIALLFGLSGEESIGLLTGSLNFIYLLLGFGWMYYLSMKEKGNNALEVAIPTFLLLPLPAFWRGIFLPVPDALMFCMFGLILLGVLRRKTFLVLPAAIAGVWVSEWLFLAALLLPLADYLRRSVWPHGYTAFGLAALIYLCVPLIAQVPDGHMVYRTGDWLNRIAEQYSGRGLSILRAFWLSFTLTLPFMAYRVYTVGWNRVAGALSIWFAAVFMLVYLLSPDTAPRIMFMTMPALVLWQYRLPTFRTMDEPLNRADESEMG